MPDTLELAEHQRGARCCEAGADTSHLTLQDAQSLSDDLSILAHPIRLQILDRTVVRVPFELRRHESNQAVVDGGVDHVLRVHDEIAILRTHQQLGPVHRRTSRRASFSPLAVATDVASLLAMARIRLSSFTNPLTAARITLRPCGAGWVP